MNNSILIDKKPPPLIVKLVMRVLLRTVVVKKEPSANAKLYIYRSVYIPALTYGLGSDRKDKFTATNGQNEVPLLGLALEIR